MDRATVEAQIAAAGPGGRLTIQFRDRLVPQLDEAGEAVKELVPKLDEAGNAVRDEAGQFVMEANGPVVLVEHPIGISRTVSSYATLYDGLVALGPGPGQPILHLIPFDDIEKVRADPADHDASVIQAGPSAPASGAAVATDVPAPATPVAAPEAPTLA